MADGSQTIDRLQVEIKLNTEALNRDLQSVNTKLDSTKTKLGSLETTSCSTAECLKGLGSSTEKVQNELEKFPDTSKNAENALKAFKYTSEFAEKAAKETGKAVQEAGGAFDKVGEAIEDAADVTEDFKKGVEKVTKPLDNVKKGVEKFSGALKFSGVAAAAALAFNIIKGEIDKARDAVHQTYTEINNLESALSKLSTGGKISLEDKIYIDQNASTITNPEQFANLYDFVGDTLSAVPKVMQQSIAEAFNLAGLATGINPTSLYSSVAQAMLAAGISPNENPEKMLEFLDRSVEATTKTGVDITSLLKTVKEYAPKIADANLTVDDLIKAGAYSYQTSFGDSEAFKTALEGILTRSQEAYDTYISNSAASQGYDNVDEYLKSLPDDIKQSVIEGAEQASKDNATTMANGVKDGFNNIDWEKAGTIAGGAMAKAQYIAGLSQDELLKLYNKEKDTTSAMFGDENGKFGLWQLFEGVNTAYAENVRELMTKKLRGDIDEKTFAKQSKALDTQKAEAETQIWIDMGTGKLVGGTKKSGAEYLKERIELSGMDIGEAILYQAGNYLNDVGSDLVERANYDLNNLEGGNPSSPTKSFLTAGTAAASLGEGFTNLALSGSIDLKSADKDVEDLGKATENATVPIQEFTLNATDPLATSVGNVATNIQTVLDNDAMYQTMLPTQMKALGNETTAVSNLAGQYERLAAAKKAAAEA